MCGYPRIIHLESSLPHNVLKSPTRFHFLETHTNDVTFHHSSIIRIAFCVSHVFRSFPLTRLPLSSPDWNKSSRGRPIHCILFQRGNVIPRLDHHKWMNTIPKTSNIYSRFALHCFRYCNHAIPTLLTKTMRFIRLPIEVSGHFYKVQLKASFFG